MQNEPKPPASYRHKALAAPSGAIGGSFGLLALPIELPISTGIMLRSIGDIARAEGDRPHQTHSKIPRQIPISQTELMFF
jgi:hypothetical protein